MWRFVEGGLGGKQLLSRQSFAAMRATLKDGNMVTKT